MKRVSIILVSFLFVSGVWSQKLTLYGATGLMNYYGDLQNKGYVFSGSKIGLQLGANYYIANHISVNGGILIGSIQGDDKNGDGWKRRNLSFQSNVFEVSTTLEADLFEISDNADNGLYYFNNKEKKKFTPYVFAGLGFMHYNPYTFTQSGQKVFLQPLHTEGQGLTEGTGKPYQLWQVSFPMGIGFKYNVSQNMTLAVELNLRKMLTDYLDDVSASHYTDTTLLRNSFGNLSAELSYRADEVPNNNYVFNIEYRGNPKKNDGYYTTFLKFIFRFPDGVHFGR